MAEIKLTTGETCLVDDEDLEMLSKYRWNRLVQPRNTYAQTRVKGTTILMHRLILNAPKGMDVDHKDCNGLNNTRSNIRLVTRSNNIARMRSRLGLEGKMRGVHFNVSRGKWLAYISIEGVKVYLGSFDSETAAAKAYDRAAREHFGEFAFQNFPDEPRDG